MNEILHAPEFQQLESAWRGLNYLVFNSETDATLKIRVMNVGKMELYRNLQALSRRALGPEPAVQDRSTSSEFGTARRRALWRLVADYHFSHTADRRAAAARSVEDRLRVARARSSPAPIRLCSAWIRWRELTNPRDIGKLMDTPDYAAWKGLRDSVDSRYVAPLHAARARRACPMARSRSRSRNSPSRRTPTATRARNTAG